MMIAIVLLAFLAQDNVRELVEKLGSESVQEREEAAEKLKKVGKHALPELGKAAKSPDAEQAARAQYLLRVIPLREHLTPALLRLMPGLEERLSLENPHAWTQVLFDLELIRRQEKIDRGAPIFGNDVLEDLAPLAVRGAATSEEKMHVCAIIQDAALRNAAAEVATLLADPETNVRMRALSTLAVLGSPDVLSRALRDSDPLVQCHACDRLAELKAASAAPDLAPLLRSPSAHVRGAALRALAAIGAAGEVRQIAGLLEDPAPTVRYFAVRALVDLGFREGSPRLRRRLEDEDSSVRSAAVRALAELDDKDAREVLRPLLDDRFPLVRMAAADELCRLGVREAAPAFLELWKEQPGYHGRELRLKSLNGVRQPELWSRLSGLRLKEPIGATVEEARKRLAEAAGVPIDWSASGAGVFGAGPPGRSVTFVDAAVCLAPPGMEMILEPDRIRFVPLNEAVDFWSAWGRR